LLLLLLLLTLLWLLLLLLLLTLLWLLLLATRRKYHLDSVVLFIVSCAFTQIFQPHHQTFCKPEKQSLTSPGGYMLHAATTFKYTFDPQQQQQQQQNGDNDGDNGDVFFCTADCGWITGHTYVTYGPLLNGASQVVFEGVPSFPTPSRLWEIVDKYAVTHLYTAPTAIRAFMGAGDQFVTSTSRKSLKLLGSVGEPINPEAWRWFHQVVGEGRCPIVDTWWQTETGAHVRRPRRLDLCFLSSLFCG
jgi:acyl-coenzyme A synthetase/AMP-(fatty) acid ligase